MNKKLIFNKNMLSLTSRNHKLAIMLGSSEFSDSVTFKPSKMGPIVPIINIDKKERPLHSTFDPVREGIRYHESLSADGYLVFFGFGAAYHIIPFLEQSDISEILIIDRDISLFKSILSNIDLSQFITDSRIKFLIDPTPEETLEYLLANYLPAVSGNLHIMKLRSRFMIEQEYFESIMNGIDNLKVLLSDDFSVQSHFGKRWFINTLSNLKTAQYVTNILPPVKRVIVIGAGPSLDIQLPRLKQIRDSAYLIATDTSLPFLLKNNIKPDLVITIDCQHITYHHFMSGFPEDVPLVLDLASPSWLTRITDKLIFFTSGHPFSRYVNANWRKFPYIDTSGGNVTHAAVSLADKLGADEIILFGVDFSYPEGKSYARGTYLYPYFMSSANRLNSIENSFISFLFYNKKTLSKKKSFGMSYSTTPMISYKKRLEDASLSIKAQIVQAKGMGEIIDLNVKKLSNIEKDNVLPFFSAGSISFNWDKFITKYSENLKALPEPGISLSELYLKLNLEQKLLCTTLYPAAAAIRRSTGIEAPGATILKKSIEWTVALIEKYCPASNIKN